MLGIVIPYYKLAFFEDTLKSLANQTNKRFKVYIGDDASPENPSAIVEKYQEQLDLVYHRFESNLGSDSLVRHWERCITMSDHEAWFMLLGDDDILSASCVEAFYNCLSDIHAEACNVVRFASVIIDGENKQTSPLFKHPKIEKATDFFYRRFTNKTRSSLSEYVFKKSAYNTYGFFHYDMGWFTDDRAWLEFSDFKNIYSINIAYVSFRLSNDNISRKEYKRKEKTAVRLQFFKFLIAKHVLKFKKEQQKHLTLYYEQLVYQHGKVTFSFWILMIWTFLKQLNLVQCVKFTRRMFIHLKKDDQ